MPFAPSPKQTKVPTHTPTVPQLGSEHSFEDAEAGAATQADLGTQLSHAAQFGHGFPSPIQTKLNIGQPGDKYEQEADQMAAKVMRMPNPEGGVGEWGSEGAGEQLQRLPEEEEELQQRPLVQREAMPEEEDEELAQAKFQVQRQAIPDEEDEDLQMKPALQQQTVLEEKEDTLQAKPQIQANGEAPAVPANFETQLAQKRGSGNPLSNETRAFMEPRFGADFSNVRVHETPDLANSIQAQAFTHGQDIYFNSGKYNPRSSGGKELLAHELTHVVQQSDLSTSSVLQAREATSFSENNPDKLKKITSVEKLLRLFATGRTTFWLGRPEYSDGFTKDWIQGQGEGKVKDEIHRRLAIKRQRMRNDHISYFKYYVERKMGKGKIPYIDGSRIPWLKEVVNYYKGRLEEDLGGLDKEIKDTINKAGGLIVSIFTGYIDKNTTQWTPKKQGTFEEAAKRFAQHHNAVGISNNQLVTGESAAMSAKTMDEVIARVTHTKIRVKKIVGKNIPISTLAFFTHGLPNSLDFSARGDRISSKNAKPRRTISPDDFAKKVGNSLADDAKVIMYACDTAGLDEQDQDEKSDGEGTFADALRDSLNTNGQQREVWGHRNAADTIGNPKWRVFQGQKEGGQAEELFGSNTHQAADNARKRLAVAIAKAIEEKTGKVIPSKMYGSKVIENADPKKKAEYRKHNKAAWTFWRWIAREMPFVPKTMRNFEAQENNNLVGWFVHRYIQHHSKEITE